MKVHVTSYIFDAATRKITFTGYSSIALNNVLLVTNVTDNIIIFNFSEPSLGGTVSSNILTLTFDTSSMSNDDKLLIYYDDDAVSARDESLILLRKMVKLLESSAVVDSSNRQRVAVESVPSLTPIYGYGISALSSQVNAGQVSPYGLISTAYPTYVAECPVDQRWRIIHEARNAFANGIRSKLI